MVCPNCGAQVQDGALECPGCQLIFAKWAKKQAAVRQAGPAPAAAGPSPAPDGAQRPADGAAGMPYTRSELQAIVIHFPSGRASYAGWWRRIAAAVIDGWILLLATVPVMEPDQVFLLVLGNWFYFTLLESSPLQGTLGKKLLGLSVVDAAGARISIIAANKRYWAKPVWLIRVWIRCAFAYLTGNKEAGKNALLEKPFLHDRFAETLVVGKIAPFSSLV